MEVDSRDSVGNQCRDAVFLKSIREILQPGQIRQISSLAAYKLSVHFVDAIVSTNPMMFDVSNTTPRELLLP